MHFDSAATTEQNAFRKMTRIGCRGIFLGCVQPREVSMTLGAVGWFVWTCAGLVATVIRCSVEIWLMTFAVALFAAICVNDLWIASERSGESK